MIGVITLLYWLERRGTGVFKAGCIMSVEGDATVEEAAPRCENGMLFVAEARRRVVFQMEQACGWCVESCYTCCRDCRCYCVCDPCDIVSMCLACASDDD